MDLDENICLCFHVSLRKVKKFIRLEKPVRASQISQCYGAGTGCGWCRPFLEKLLTESNSAASGNTTQSGEPEGSLDSLTPRQYADLRENYVDQGKGTPPGG